APVSVSTGPPSATPRRAISPGEYLPILYFSIPFFRGVAEASLYCAHRTSTFLSCAFCEQEGHLAAPLSPSETARCASKETSLRRFTPLFRPESDNVTRLLRAVPAATTYVRRFSNSEARS